MNAAAITLVVFAFLQASLHVACNGRPRGNYHALIGLMDLALSLFLFYQAGLFQ